jgi:hypothetical protein
VIGVIAGEGRPIISPVGLLVLHNGLFRISDRGGPDKFSFREKGEKRGHGVGAGPNRFPQFFSIRGRAKGEKRGDGVET